MLEYFMLPLQNSMIKDNYGIQYVMPSLSIATQDDRDAFILSCCKSQNVLNVGCVGTKAIPDSLHIKINEISATCAGIDLSLIHI